MSQIVKPLSVAFATFAASSAAFGAIVVNQIETIPSYAEDAWYEADVRDNGTASIVDLTGAGGDLEANQPLPNSVVKLTTGFANNDKAEIGTAFDFGFAAEVLNSIELGYSFYKELVVGGNMAAAPSIKLAILAVGGAGDNYGQLIYEPYWNGGNPATDVWTDVAIDQDTGSGADGSGGWWWSGGFEVASGAAGPPMRSLAEWAAVFSASDAVDFANAHVVGLSVGVGTYNQGQVDYFDNVSVKTGNIDKTYDFEVAASRVPDSGSALSLLFGSLLGLVALRRRAGRSS